MQRALLPSDAIWLLHHWVICAQDRLCVRPLLGGDVIHQEQLQEGCREGRMRLSTKGAHGLWWGWSRSPGMTPSF